MRRAYHLARRLHRDAARRQSARGGARRRGPRRCAHAGDRARVQSRRDRVRAATRAIPSIPRRCAFSRRRANCRSPAIRRSARRRCSPICARRNCSPRRICAWCWRRRSATSSASRAIGEARRWPPISPCRACPSAPASRRRRRGARREPRPRTRRHRLWRASADRLQRRRRLPLRRRSPASRRSPGEPATAPLWGESGGPGALSLHAEAGARARLSRPHVRAAAGASAKIRRPARPPRRFAGVVMRLRPAGRRRAHAGHRAGRRDGPPERDRRSASRSRTARCARRRSAAPRC